MSPPAGGDVATSTENRPLDSKMLFKIGVVTFHSWLFWPSMISARSFSVDSAGAWARRASLRRDATITKHIVAIRMFFMVVVRSAQIWE
jgi:hypothetical protein